MTSLEQKAGLRPPFELQHQLATVDQTSASSKAVEQERLRQILREDDLELMHKQLWYAGRIGNISALHHQRVLRRDIVLTERARLHLIWYDRTIYIKRLEDELLDWTCFSEIVCGDETLHQAASGFLLSYTYLIQYPSDLEIAKSSGLVNKTITWQSWQKFHSSIQHHLADRDIHDRYEYGELRLGRLNQIYRFKCLGLAYFTVYRDYSSYFGDNYMTLIALFALVSVALSAMQVMTSVEWVPEAVARTSYRFSIATLVGLAGSCAVLLALLAGMYVWNWAMIFVRREPKRRRCAPV